MRKLSPEQRAALLKSANEATGPYQCPFCPGTFSVSNPEDMDTEATILHTLPTCKQYDAIETMADATRYMQCSHN